MTEHHFTSENAKSRGAGDPPNAAGARTKRRYHRVKMDLERIPLEMREAPRWAVAQLWWSTERKTGKRKLKKDILQARNLRLKASSTDPTTWSSFEEAWAVYEAGKCCVLMFAMGDGWAGADWDEVRDPASGVVELWVLDEVRALASYAEASCGGGGVGVVVHGTLPCPEGCKGEHIELYDHARWLSVTSRKLPNAPATVEPRTERLAALVAKYFPKKVAAREHVRTPVAPVPLPEDAALLDLARHAQDGGKFAHLFDDGE